MEEAAVRRKRQRERGLTTTQRRNQAGFRTQWNRFVPNGSIDTTVRLAIALRFFAGGNIYDTAPLYGVGRSDAFSSVWMVVEAIHCVQPLNVCFPKSHTQQRERAREFSTRSQAGFDWLCWRCGRDPYLDIAAFGIVLPEFTL